MQDFGALGGTLLFSYHSIFLFSFVLRHYALFYDLSWLIVPHTITQPIDGLMSLFGFGGWIMGYSGS